jgi:hypothetical protein|eukprot:COSAG06_NODE_386_length_16443_cov_314.441936_15_plen_58_part_00
MMSPALLGMPVRMLIVTLSPFAIAPSRPVGPRRKSRSNDEDTETREANKFQRQVVQK